MKLLKKLRSFLVRTLNATDKIPPKPRIDHDLIARYVSRSISPDAVYIEVGAATGATAEIFSRLASLKPQNCYLIEACPKNCEVMRKKIPGYRIFNFAVSDKIGQIPFYVYDDPAEPGSSRSNSLNKAILQQKKSAQEISEIMVPATTLNDFFRDNAISQCDYLFMNIEGAEYDVFAGDCSFLQKVRFFYVDLHYGLYRGTKSAEEMIQTKLQIYDFLSSQRFTRVGGHLRDDISWYNGHLSFLWERDKQIL